jgi:hypothetical protein
MIPTDEQLGDLPEPIQYEHQEPRARWNEKQVRAVQRDTWARAIASLGTIDLSDEWPTSRYFVKQVMARFGIGPNESIASALEKLYAIPTPAALAPAESVYQQYAGEKLEKDMAPIRAALAPVPEPAVNAFPRCTHKLRAQGKAYPRTCEECKLGPCRAPTTTEPTPK